MKRINRAELIGRPWIEVADRISGHTAVCRSCGSVMDAADVARALSAGLDTVRCDRCGADREFGLVRLRNKAELRPAKPKGTKATKATETGTEPDAKPDVKPDVKPDTKPGDETTKPGTTAETETKPDVKPDAGGRRLCPCCLQPVVSRRAWFLPGHDARLAKMLREAGGPEDLQTHLRHIWATWVERGKPKHLLDLVKGH